MAARPLPASAVAPAGAAESPCQSCGACCAYSPDWPRFTVEDDWEIELIPAALRSERRGAQPWFGMRCDSERCAALSGEIGVATACAIYEIRPEVCRACMPGDEECGIARRRYGMAPLPAAE